MQALMSALLQPALSAEDYRLACERPKGASEKRDFQGSETRKECVVYFKTRSCTHDCALRSCEQFRQSIKPYARARIVLAALSSHSLFTGLRASEGRERELLRL